MLLKIFKFITTVFLLTLFAYSQNYAQLSGSYTIPGSPFATIKAAVDSLNLVGVGGGRNHVLLVLRIIVSRVRVLYAPLDVPEKLAVYVPGFFLSSTSTVTSRPRMSYTTSFTLLATGN